MTKIVLEMVSDLACPWCWLGLRRLKQAMDIASEVEVELYFRPFELDPTIPEGGTDYKAAMKARFSSDEAKERSNAMKQALIDYGKAEGIPFDFDAITIRPNTLNAHRLVRWAQGQGVAAEVKEALFTAYMSEGKNISDLDVLADIGASCGMDRGLLSDLLAGDADMDAVRQEAGLFRQMGINGVPTYVANRAVAVQGAESAEKLAKFIRAQAMEAVG